MKAIFLTQSGTLDFFRGLQLAMAKSHGLERAGYFVADSRYFDRFVVENPDFPGREAVLVKEWEVFARAESRRPGPERLADLERRLGHPTLWNALVADRRVYLGTRSTYSQDYAPRFSHERMLGLVDAMAEALEGLFDEVQPDFVAGFICVTLGDYLGWRIAQARGIPYLNLRPTRVDNYIFAGEGVLEPSELLQKAYEEALKEDGSAPEFGRAQEILALARKEHALYEGVYKPSAKTPEENLKKLEAGRSQAQIWADRLRQREEILHPLPPRQPCAGLCGSLLAPPGDKAPPCQADGPCAQAPLRRGGKPARWLVCLFPPAHRAGSHAFGLFQALAQPDRSGQALPPRRFPLE